MTTLATNAVQVAPEPLFRAVATVVAAPVTSTATLGLVQQTMKAMLRAKLQTAASIAAACLVAASIGTLVAQQGRKPAGAAPGPNVVSAEALDRTTPLGALRDFAEALDKSDSNRVIRALHVTTPAARKIATALSEAVEAERQFKLAVGTRFGGRTVKVININFGQRSLNDEVAVESAVQYADADHAVVSLPSHSSPEQLHKVSLVRVDGVWKFSDKDFPGIDDGPAAAAEVFRKAEVSMTETRGEIESGRYQTYEAAMRALSKRFMNSR
jgi:hypothetical protein